jgi:hypothetical protein
VCCKPVGWLQGIQQLLIGWAAQFTSLSLCSSGTAVVQQWSTAHSMAQHDAVVVKISTQKQAQHVTAPKTQCLNSVRDLCLSYVSVLEQQHAG